MHASVTRRERNHPDQHNRDRDAQASRMMSEGTAYTEKQVLAWGKLAAQQIARGNYQTAINQLSQALMLTMQSQYTGRDFSN